jgi:iron(III) transport system permease protein
LIVTAALLLLVGVFLGYPTVRLLLLSVIDPVHHAWTLQFYVRLFEDSTVFSAFGNTLEVGFACLGLALVIAVPLALIVARTNVPGSTVIHNCVLLTFTFPSFLGAMGWIILLGPRAGLINLQLQNAFDLRTGPFDVFSRWGIIFVLALYTFPLLYIQLVPALRNMGQDMEDSARLLGAGVWRRLRTITIPLVLPALSAGSILVLLEAIVLFGIPSLLGVPTFFYVVPTKTYQLFATYPPNFEMAAAMTVPIFMFTILLLVVERAILKKRRFVTVTGRGRGHRPAADVGYWKWPILVWAWLIIGLCLLLPICAFLFMSLAKVPANGISLDNLTLERFQEVFTGSELVARAFRNSFILAAGAAFVSIALSFVLVWIVERSRLPVRNWISVLAIAPLAYPGIVLGVALSLAFAGPPLALYGTLWIFLVAYVIKSLPISVSFLRAAFSQIHVDLERCARVLGASPARLLFDITFPLVRNDVISTGMTIFSIKFRDLATSIFLYVTGTEVIAVLLYDFSTEGYYGRMAALSVVVIAINAVLVTAAGRLGSANRHADGNVGAIQET